MLAIYYQLGKNLNLDDEIRLNNGHHTAEFLLREALSLALNTDHSQISIISKTLLDRYSELNHFNIDGIYIKKSVLAEWANNQNLPKKFNATQRVAAYEQYLESLKKSTSSQSVHADAVVAYTKPYLDEIRTRLQDRKINLLVDTKNSKNNI